MYSIVPVFYLSCVIENGSGELVAAVLLDDSERAIDCMIRELDISDGCSDPLDREIVNSILQELAEHNESGNLDYLWQDCVRRFSLSISTGRAIKIHVERPNDARQSLHRFMGMSKVEGWAFDLDDPVSAHPLSSQ